MLKPSQSVLQIFEILVRWFSRVIQYGDDDNDDDDDDDDDDEEEEED